MLVIGGVRHDHPANPIVVDDGVMTEHNAVTRADLIAAVERSPEAVGVHDREAWIGAFGSDAKIEDPVGAKPHRGSVEIGRFYDTFVGPRDITFHRDVDIVVGSTVIRDLDLEVTMASTLTMRIPAYLRYDLDAHRQIAGLAAYWQLPTMVRQFALSGLAAIPAGLALSSGLIRNQGLAGTAGFLSGFRGVGGRGRSRLARLLDDACGGDEVAVKRQLSDDVAITLGEHERLATVDLVARLGGGRPDKILAAGDTVVARVDVDGRRSVVMMEMRRSTLAITRIRLYDEAV